MIGTCIFRKLFSLVAVLAVTVGVLGALGLADARQRLQAADALRHGLDGLEAAALFLHELQQERGLTLLLLEGATEEALREQLADVRQRTDATLVAYGEPHPFPADGTRPVAEPPDHHLSSRQLQALREAADAGVLSADEAFEQYSRWIAAGVRAIADCVVRSRVGELSRPLVAHLALVRALVDDHPVVRAGYRRLLDANDDIQVVAEADSGLTAIQAYQRAATDVVLMDINMPDMSGLDAARRLLELAPDARILVFTMYDDQTTLTEAMHAGVLGYVTKRAAAEIVLCALRKVARGGLFVDPELGSLMVGKPPGQKQNPLYMLTPRESEIFRLLANGETVVGIADLLGISAKTVGVHQTRIMRKLGARTSVQLVHLAARYGVIQLSSQ
jgi:two-component system invasion response regulator UvrY